MFPNFHWMMFSLYPYLHCLIEHAHAEHFPSDSVSGIIVSNQLMISFRLSRYDDHVVNGRRCADHRIA